MAPYTPKIKPTNEVISTNNPLTKPFTNPKSKITAITMSIVFTYLILKLLSFLLLFNINFKQLLLSLQFHHQYKPIVFQKPQNSFFVKLRHIFQFDAGVLFQASRFYNQ